MAEPPSNSTDPNASRQNSDADWSYEGSLKACASLPTASAFYSFQHYSALADFLSESLEDYGTYEPKNTAVVEPSIEDPPATFHSYLSDGSLQKKCARNETELLSILKCPQQQGNTGTIVFLRGNQTKEWITAIGDNYRIDHEFWRRHLDSGHSTGEANIYTDSFLPSSNTNMLQMRMTTLGEKREANGLKGKSRHEALALRRQQADISMTRYTEGLSRRRSPMRHGESVVRHFSLHDLYLFSIEQNISVWMGSDPQGTGWVATVVIWLDFGRNLCQVGSGESAPWQSDSTSTTAAPVHCKPTVQYRPGIVLNRQVHRSNRRRKTGGGDRGDDDKGSIAQTACLLHEECGNLLDKSVACHDPYYACSDVFRFVAAAEAQFLEMAEVMLTREMAASRHGSVQAEKPLIMWSLQYNRQALMRHLENIQAILEFVEGREQSDYSHQGSLGEKSKVAGDMAKLLVKDYRYLLRRAEALAREYQAGMTTLMNAATIDESQRAIVQAEGIIKLTGLAFFFVPLTFTTSIFGMNFKEITEGSQLSIWVWGIMVFISLSFSAAFQQWFSWRQKGHTINKTKAWITKE
ncbi:hypothetical protein LCI18_005711 [Fusarium solani-melongenae]|uniref:Uncharacterized protein n=1 Tax=Fusarium solani subsp. cucurbitae TaxID=2747967 RepID=A0ACD3Z1N8_FUSSC|nr:hypothetical protein LCI18_005711 [Fusarium solani-melongenae]